MDKQYKPEPVVLPDVATEPHPTANAIPEPPGTAPDTKQEVVSDVREPIQEEGSKQ